MKKFALIVAGGTGTRMYAGLPKQFLLLNNKPILMHTIDIFRKYDPEISILVVLAAELIETWNKLCVEYNYLVEHKLGRGGETRFHSVKNNLGFIPDDCLVAVHDGVRPLVSLETIDRCFIGAHSKGNAIPCVKIPETLRSIENEKSAQVNRDQYRLIQTPQVFRSDILKDAYKQEFRMEFTDDAGVVESAGYSIHLVEGNPENIKITFVNDLKIANALII